MTDPSISEPVGPEEAFAVLSDGNRIEILRALWEIDDHQATFSDLHDAVDIDDSGQFNYHLNQLTGQFVGQTDDGYMLRPPGVRVVGALLAGGYTMTLSTDEIALDDPCPSCGDSLAYRYEDGFARFVCEDCGTLVQYPIPPGAFTGLEPAEMPDRTMQYLRALGEQLRNDLCPHCDGHVAPTVVVHDQTGTTGDATRIPAVEYDCARCDATFNTELGTPFLSHPAVVSFFYDRGIDVQSEPIWRFGAFNPERTSIRNDDPLLATIDFTAAGDTITLAVDEQLAVEDIERS